MGTYLYRYLRYLCFFFYAHLTRGGTTNVGSSYTDAGSFDSGHRIIIATMFARCSTHLIRDSTYSSMGFAFQAKKTTTRDGTTFDGAQHALVRPIILEKSLRVSHASCLRSWDPSWRIPSRAGQRQLSLRLWNVHATFMTLHPSPPRGPSSDSGNRSLAESSLYARTRRCRAGRTSRRERRTAP